MPSDHIHLMNDIIQRAIAKRDQEMKSPGTDEDGLILCSKVDMTEETGTVAILPMDRNPPEDDKHRVQFTANTRPDAAECRPAYDHGKKDQIQADLRGYFGCDPGAKILCPAGGIAVFSSLTLHCSSPNRSGALRSALNVQYASTPLMSEDGQSFRHKADPFVVERETAEDVKQWQK
ncbi:unnamed protein product [Didymodactylos carnosus]|uniref:Phytanoyl-CoA dioxygenase n=1 Tax=Didymodactylos carnosus TaxID=1234261 RepID=A0A815T5E7_9BILA|nr:unnamed protein product [Didymodactylos carnosus]CAF4364763.1 unnamed protein product [Didymodactylos carnosus]